MKIKFDVVKVTAVGYGHHFMTYVSTNGAIRTIHITQDLYVYLKSLGVPTGQKMRYKKEKNDGK